jgi:hypothetical protein
MKLEISAPQLSFGLHSDDVARVQQAIEALGRDIPADEADRRVFGPGTTAVLKALQTDLSVPATGVVDAATVRVINAALANLATEGRTVRGRVSDADGNPANGLSVQLYLEVAADERVIGTSALDADGAYRIAYQPPENSARIDLRIEVRDQAGAVETTPPAASILANAGALEVVNLVLSGAAHPSSSEFDLVLADLKPLLGSRDPAQLKEGANNHEASLLAVQSGWPSAEVAALAIASRLASEAKVPAPLLYGLLREGCPADLAALQAMHPDVQLSALKAAVAKGTVPKNVDGRDIESYLSGLTPQPNAQLKTLLGRVLQPPELDQFLAAYLKSGQDPAVFWKSVATDPILGGRAGALKLTVQLAGLTDNHDPLVDAVLARSDVKEASDLARLTEAQWLALVQMPGVGVPDNAPGASADEKTRNYVGQILTRVEAAFPTQFFAAKLGDSPIAKVLQDAYDLKRTYPTLFFKQNPAAAQALNPEQRQQLGAFQRIYRLTDNAQQTLALSAKGIGSAQQITRVPRQVFADQHKDVLSPDRANQIYDRALKISAMALALFAENAAAMNRIGLHVLPRLDTKKQADVAASNPIPDWQTLFGTLDSCACQDCASVHGAAAYLVDALHFLDDRGVRAPLFNRRPDLGDIELSCENTDAQLPLVDLVNETLEDAVVRPAPFTQFNLAPALETDLGQPVASAALTAAFTPPLAAGARVETIENGARWRVWDEPFAYSVIKQTGGLNVAARSRQTTGSAAERRATPQYRNAAAYTELAQSVYPWILPFDLYHEQAKVFLAYLGVPRRDLIEALRPLPEPFNPTAPVVLSLAAEGLGLSDTERKIIVGEALPTPHAPEDFWGSASITALTTVRELLDRSGLSYSDLEALLGTRFVNPAAAVTIAPKSGAGDACDTTALQINGLTADVLSRLHVFVRLWRKLGWQVPELDRAICALAVNSNAPALTNEVLVRLDHLRSLCSQLRLSVVETLAFWGPIDTVEPGSLYGRLFYNPAVFKPQDQDFRLRSDGKELADTNKKLADHAAALQAVFQLDAAAFALLVAKTDGALNLANLSLMYRHASLARQLRLTVEYLLRAIDLIRIDPFQGGHTEDTLRLVVAVTAIQGSGFEFPWLDYLLRHRFSSAAPFVPADSSLAQVLQDIRAGLLKADAPIAADKQKLQQSAVIDRAAAALRLRGDVTADLLGSDFPPVSTSPIRFRHVVVHGGQTALQRFLALSSINAETLSRANAQPQFETLEKLLKIARVIEALKLPSSQLDWLFRENPWLAQAPDPVVNPMLLANWFSLVKLDRLRQDLALGDAALEGVLGAISAIASATDQPGQLAAKQAFLDALATWLGWKPADLETLIGKSTDLTDLTDLGLLGARLPADYGVDLLVRLSRAIAALKRLGVTAAQATRWCEATVSDAAAKEIRNAAKSKCDSGAWDTVDVPLQDSLRDKQREALVSYLAARPSKWTTSLDKATADDLYAHFLIDVQMSACQQTSRIAQAIGSVQLFAQRCLMGLEAGIQTSDPKWRQWNDWMKNFRVWEANRKIWVYPENWIEPELRDDKSPFFKDLENELLQSNLDNAAAEQALMNYLEKLDQVARLQIAGTYEDEHRTLHVFGRTFNTPHVYFYRRREGATLSWTAWEKLEVDIEGDHLIPVVWNRKLMLIWPIFTQKQDEQPVTMPQVGGTLHPGNRYWEIQLAWSEYQYGHWTGKSLSDPVRLDAYLGLPDILFGDYVPAPRMAQPIHTNGGGGGIGGGGGGGGGGGAGGGGNTGSTSTNDGASLVPQDRMTFKAFISPEILRVRGYLRLDYTGAGAGPGVAYPFGEFRFSGCRKIVSAAHLSQMLNRTFALAPQGTEFDAMWFAETGSGLTMLDGTFTSRPIIAPPSIFADVNEPAPLPENPSALTAEAINIPVLGGAASPFRLLAPHQDPQFIGDRPFFYMDEQRAFAVSSTGHSGFVVRPENWVLGDIATVGMATLAPSPNGGTTPSPDKTSALTILVPGPGGTRIARELTPIDLSPSSNLQKAFPRFWSDRAYTFRNFHHPYVCKLVESLEETGINALLSLDSQSQGDNNSFQVYKPTGYVKKPYPVDEVEFQSGDAYELYNWELFFHIPLLIATRLSSNQCFEDAQRWFHYIFDPTGVSGNDIPGAYWRMKPFHDRSAGDYEQQSVENIEKIAAQGAPEDLVVAVNLWRDNPFNPYAVARLRTTAFQKTVVMKYIDNLIAWGDHLFRGDTIEAINEATQLYVLAAAILGRRPEIVKRKVQPPVQTFNSLGQLGLLSNALEQIELLIPDAGSGGATDDGTHTVDPPKVPYFCVQENDKLVGYWNTVERRLFNIRHCMNIEGQVRQLPLFAPPIDPALLVRAHAAGLSLAEVLSDISGPLPHYRFAVMLQKANEVAAEVRNLGAELLSVLEKNDAERLATLRSGQELRLLQAVRDTRVRQVEEANANVEALKQSQAMAQARKTYYESREFMSAGEQGAETSLERSRNVVGGKFPLQILAAVFNKFGNNKLGSPTTAGIELGAGYIAGGLSFAVAALETTASVLSIESQLQGRVAEYHRRQDEWDHQANLATIELKQIDKQFTAAEVRLAIAQQDLSNHDQQIDNARATDEYLRGKFTNQDLYQWMVGQVSGLYFQSYQLAYDLAKRAERCMQHELGLAYGETSFIRFGYWDSLKKGLLAADHLAHDLKRLDVAYLDGNVREYELTKHVSLVSLAPGQLIALKETGTCEFEVPEWLFDLDTPGHYRRRIEMVSVTIPCVVGPYASIHCKVQLLKNSYRTSDVLTPRYERDLSGPDNRFVDDRKVVEATVTSTAQNDAGLFEPSLRDERYLPFQGAGAISTWRLDLSKQFKTFDYSTISDVILHLRYTARDGGQAMSDAAEASVASLLADASTRRLRRFFSLRHEFPTEWNRFVNSQASAMTTITVDLGMTRFPYFAQGRHILVREATPSGRSKSGTPPQLAIAPGQTPPAPGSTSWTGQQDPGPWTVGTTADPKSIEDVFLILKYTV